VEEPVIRRGDQRLNSPGRGHYSPGNLSRGPHSSVSRRYKYGMARRLIKVTGDVRGRGPWTRTPYE
jgi:hypothetical protein